MEAFGRLANEHTFGGVLSTRNRMQEAQKKLAQWASFNGSQMMPGLAWARNWEPTLMLLSGKALAAGFRRIIG